MFGVIHRWNGEASVIRISKETEKTVTASEWSSWINGEWGRETRMGRERVLARFDTQEAAQKAVDAAKAAYIANTPTVEAAKISLTLAENDRLSAWNMAIMGASQ